MAVDPRFPAASALRDKGLSYEEIGTALGVSRAAVAGIFFRSKRLLTAAPRKAAKRARPPLNVYRDIVYEPSKTPFAPDCSCPEFAWDEAHCDAVSRLGGFPVLEVRR